MAQLTAGFQSSAVEVNSSFIYNLQRGILKGTKVVETAAYVNAFGGAGVEYDLWGSAPTFQTMSRRWYPHHI